MTHQRLETQAVVMNYVDTAHCIEELGGTEFEVPKGLSHFMHSRGVPRVLRQIHVITDVAGLPARVHSEFVKAGANIHKAHGTRTEALTAVHALRMAENCDVLALVVADCGYLPLIRECKSLGCRVELHALWTVDPVLFPAADEVVGFYPPGAPIRLVRPRIATVA